MYNHLNNIDTTNRFEFPSQTYIPYKVHHHNSNALHVKAMRKEDLIFQDYTVRLGGAKWDLKIHTESRFTVT